MIQGARSAAPSPDKRIGLAASGRVETALARCGYSESMAIKVVFPMTKSYLETAVEVAQEAGKILIEEL